MRKVIFLLLFCLLIINSCANHTLNKQLDLVKIYEVHIQNSIEPSGLTEWDGEFYTISDKHNVIYRLEFDQKKIDLNPIIKINHSDNTILDFEGITHDDDNFYLVSERLFKILKVSRDGKEQEWIPNDESLKISGKNAGLFKLNNANLEGICLLDNQSFLLAAERQPRGFIEYNSDRKINAYQVNAPIFEYEQDRSPDFTGLSCDDKIYVLDRNAYMVAELNNVDGQYIESKGYSYENTVKQPQYQYQNMQFGLAEGLVVKGNKIFIILDNNKNPRKLYPKNNNSLFLELEK